MTNQMPNSNNQTNYDLEKRTTEFSERIIDLVKSYNQNSVIRPIISQLVRSGTSIGANYCEANEANSKKDFHHKISLSKKEAKETMYWLKIINKIDKSQENEVQKLWKEAHEFVLIFAAILRNKK